MIRRACPFVFVSIFQVLRCSFVVFILPNASHFVNPLPHKKPPALGFQHLAVLPFGGRFDAVEVVDI